VGIRSIRAWDAAVAEGGLGGGGDLGGGGRTGSDGAVAEDVGGVGADLVVAESVGAGGMVAEGLCWALRLVYVPLGPDYGNSL